MLYRKVRHPWRNFAFRDKLMVNLLCAEWFDDEPEEFYLAWIYYLPCNAQPVGEYGILHSGHTAIEWFPGRGSSDVSKHYRAEWDTAKMVIFIKNSLLYCRMIQDLINFAVSSNGKPTRTGFQPTYALDWLAMASPLQSKIKATWHNFKNTLG